MYAVVCPAPSHPTIFLAHAHTHPDLHWLLLIARDRKVVFSPIMREHRETHVWTEPPCAHQPDTIRPGTEQAVTSTLLVCRAIAVHRQPAKHLHALCLAPASSTMPSLSLALRSHIQNGRQRRQRTRKAIPSGLLRSVTSISITLKTYIMTSMGMRVRQYNSWVLGSMFDTS